MASRGDRFRRLRTPQTGDLFEHFGLTVEATPEPASGARPVATAAPCGQCGWLRPTPMREACPLCGAPGRP